jgi:flagellar FliJ protein
MTTSSTLTTLIELAQDRKTKAAQDFAQAASAHERARERLTLIENYRSEYEARMRDQAGVGVDSTLIGNTMRFISQLTVAIEQQGMEVARCAAHVETTRAAFLDEERKLKSLEILAQREAQREAAIEAKRQQKQIDEYATRRSFGPQTGFAL